MKIKPQAMYQGNDWFTHRWLVAQAFDTLDRMRDICSLPSEAEIANLTQARLDLLTVIADLCDDLAGEIAIAEADLLPVFQNRIAQRWTAFEM
ncbi:MAG: hypothetical protein PHX43_08130, partial [Alphaproteobacteria bacterium]|nr:hypothetical protein [Alphaproteobacteria bacterium]